MKDTYEISKDTMTGDIRDAFLESMRNLPKPWQQMSKSEKDDQAERAEKAAESIVEQAVKLIASAACEKIEVRIKKYSDDGKKLKIELVANSEDADKIVGLVDSPVLLVTNPSSEFKGQRAPVNNKADDRQRDMFENCNTEYQEADGEGVPGPVEGTTEPKTEEAIIEAEAPSAQLALPAPQVVEDDNVVDADYEEVHETENIPIETDENSDSQNPENISEKVEISPDTVSGESSEEEQQSDPIEEAENYFFDGEEETPDTAA